MPDRQEIRHTKLVCTLGPASLGCVRELVEAGMDVARINFSHGTPQDHRRALDAVRRASEETGKTVAVLADLSGPKVRLGGMNAEPVTIPDGGRFVLDTDPATGDETRASVSHPGLPHDLEPGDRVLLADGAVELRVAETNGERAVCDVVRAGRVRSRVGVNVPSERLSLPAVTDKDKADLARALEMGIDVIAQSFVRGPEDIRALRDACGGAPIRVVAKIETRPAVDTFEAIAEEAEAVMLARGDLGVELAFEELPLIQKDLVRRATRTGIPMIVATQMLESMTASPRPTRAEATDVANAVLDGADGLLLSAETAIGRYPIEAARTATRIVRVAEDRGGAWLPEGERRTPGSGPQAIARAATALADADPRVSVICCFTRTGRTGQLLSAARPRVPVHAFTPDLQVARFLALHRSVTPHVCDTPPDTDTMITLMDERLTELELARAGTVVVMVASTPVGRSQTNLLKLHRVGHRGF